MVPTQVTTGEGTFYLFGAMEKNSTRCGTHHPSLFSTVQYGSTMVNFKSQQSCAVASIPMKVYYILRESVFGSFAGVPSFDLKLTP